MPSTQPPTTAKQPPTEVKQLSSPYGDDIEEVARRYADATRNRTRELDPIDRYDRREWWRLVHVRAAQLIGTEGKGEALAALAEQGKSLREIEALLVTEGMPLSDSAIGKLITAARAAHVRDAAAHASEAAAS